jgi:hypothetical protein
MRAAVSHRRPTMLAVTFLLSLPAVGLAQEEPDAASRARMRVGPVAITPTVSTHIGTDTNVFNEPEDPKQDLVGTFQPRVDAWLRLGRAQLTGTSSVDFVYFNEYTSERSINTANSIKLRLPVNRLRPYMAFSYLNSRERLNAEVDTRARHLERVSIGGVDVRLAERTLLGLAVQRSDFAFDDDSEAPQYDLRESLNRDSTSLVFSLRRPLTPLTTFVLLTQAQRDRFQFSPARDSDSAQVTPGLEFSNFALLNGTAYVGMRRFVPKNPHTPSYTGVVASVNLGYTLLGSTRFQVQVSRDVEYSVEIVQPYYVLTGIVGTVTRRVSERWELVGTAGRQRLAYRTIQGVAIPSADPTSPDPSESSPIDEAMRLLVDRTDTVTTCGAGIGYRLGPDTRVGLNADYYRRHSVFDGRTYRSLRVNSVVTYRF